MKTWKQLGFDLGLALLFPRLCLYVLLPCLILFLPFLPNLTLFPQLIQRHPVYVRIVFVITASLFLLSVADNLLISRYLRQNWAEESPYNYEAGNGFPSTGRYFRISVREKPEFDQLLKRLRHDPAAGAISRWLRIDDLLMAPPIILLVIVLVLFSLMAYPIKGLMWVRRKILRSE